MAMLQLPRNETTTYKKRRVFRTNNGTFIQVKCKDCGETTVCYSHSQTNIKCNVCTAPLLKPTGGKAKLTAGVGSKIAENQY